MPLAGKTKLVTQVVVASCATLPKLTIVTNKSKTVAQLAQRSPINNYECLEQVMFALWHKWHN